MKINTQMSQIPMSEGDFLAWLLSDEGTLSNRTVSGSITSPVGTIGKKLIANCVFEGSLNLWTTDVGYLQFEDCHFKSKVELSCSEIKHKIEFIQCKITDLTFESSGLGYIKIGKSQITGSVLFSNLENIANIILSESTFSKNVTFAGVLMKDENSYVFLRDVTIAESLNIHDDSEIYELQLASGNIHRLNIHGRVKHLKVLGPSNHRVLEELEIDYHNYASSVTIEKAKIGLLSMNHTTASDAVFRFFSVEIKEWRMENSSLQDFVGTNLNLRKCKIQFDHSQLAGCTFSNVQWPKNKRLVSYIVLEPDKHSALREAYRQLKQAMLKDGNTIDALAFYRNEMEEYHLQIKGDNEVDWQTKTIVWLGKWASDHGQNFWQPIKRMTVIHLFLLIVLILLGFHDCRWVPMSQHDWTTIGILFGEYFKLINPAHSVENMDGPMFFIDLLMRISSGFFIYHVIRASRKFA